MLIHKELLPRFIYHDNFKADAQKGKCSNLMLKLAYAPLVVLISPAILVLYTQAS